MFRDLPGCSGMFRNVPCSGFYRRPPKWWMSQYIYNKHNTTWKVLCTVFTDSLFLYRNLTRSLRSLVRFLIQKRVRKYRTKHFPCGILFIIYILRHSSFWRPFYFKSFKNAKICRYTLTAKWHRKRSIRFLVKTFVKNITESKDMR